jgi:hypothetical protein
MLCEDTGVSLAVDGWVEGNKKAHVAACGIQEALLAWLAILVSIPFQHMTRTKLCAQTEQDEL